MIQAEEEYDEEELGPSLAMPPLYVVRAADRCPECGQAMYVYTLGCGGFHDAEDGRPAEVFHFLRYVIDVPENVSRILKARCPGYYLDTGEDGEIPYLMNHCPCGAKLDDDFVSGDIGATFCPDTPDGFAKLKLFRLPIREPIPIRCSTLVGGEEYMDFARAEWW